MKLTPIRKRTFALYARENSSLQLLVFQQFKEKTEVLLPPS